MPQSEMVLNTEKSLDMKLEASVGRRARDRRNNLFYDCEDRIVYITGNNFVIYSKELSSQSFLQYNNRNMRVNMAEISCFCLYPDKRMVFLGTSELEAKVMLWHLTSYVMILSLSINNVCIIQSMTLSSSCRYLACVALNQLYQQELILIEVSIDFSAKVLARASVFSSCVFKIKNLLIEENDGIQILTCGIQHFMR